MKNSKERFAYFFKRTFSGPSNTVFSALLLLLVFGFTACNQNGCDQPRPQGNCDTYATVENDGCWNGYLGSFWFRLPSGEVLLPQSSQVNIPSLHHGQQVKLAFETVAPDSAYQNHCNYFAANNERPIRITCFETLASCGTPATNTECNTYATATNVPCGPGLWGNTWLKLDDGTFLQPWEANVSGSIEAGKRYKFAYTEVTRDNRYHSLVICQAVPPVAKAVRITCLEEQISE